MFDVFYFDSGLKPNLFAHERAVESIQHAQQLSRTRYFWVVNYLADYSDWDWLYEPVPWQAHHMHIWPSQHHDYSGTYLVPTQPTDQINFHSEIVPNRSVRHNWKILHPIIEDEWDWTWAPHPLAPPYIYVWGNQHWSAEQMPTVEYHVAGATERKYMPGPAQLVPNSAHWTTIDCADTRSIDFSWVPDPGEPPYIYVWGNQWHPAEIMPTATYCVPGATEHKFMSDQVPVLPNKQHWHILEEIDHNKWDWSWVPSPLDPPYVYVWGNQWNNAEHKASITYTVPGATDVKYMDRRTHRLPQPQLFRHNLAVSKFDYSWEPNPFDPPMTYVWGNQWNPAVLEPTVIYSTGGTEIKYMDNIVATVAQDTTTWTLLDDIEEFDYSWRPNPTDPPYIYVFGNQWLTPEQRPALKYCVPGATEIKYISHPRARRKGDQLRFVQHYPVSFDWSWEPDPGSPPFNYVFGNQYYSAEVMPTVEYHMPAATERKYMDISAELLPCHDNHWHTMIDCEWDYTWRPEPGSPPYIYVWGNQWWSAEKMPTVEYHMPGATERKYMTAPVANLLVNMTNWYVPAYIDTTDMDFSWQPDPGEPPYVYQFATQHQKTGGPQYRVPGATEFKYVDMMRADVKKEAAPIFEIDHLDGAAGQIENNVRRVRYFDNYRDTLIRLAKSLVGQYEHVWVCSSICDYSGFDFSWHPERWQSTMLHVFASNEQKFGDTFYMHVPTFAERAEKKALLEWYDINFVKEHPVPRRAVPCITHNSDTHVNIVMNTETLAPLTVYSNRPVLEQLPTVPLWREETKTIVPLDSAASVIIVPRAAKAYVKTQLYDYPYINKTYRNTLTTTPQDIVFISYDEPEADTNWQQLAQHFPRAQRVHGIKGMENALAEAARVSKTPWYFAVFGKTVLAPAFDFEFQPDYMQQPKHYIFYSENRANKLVYGEMAIIMYNCHLILDNHGKEFGLDYTMSFPHEVVPILSTYGNFDTSPYHAWRTAFRETAKLAYFENQQSTVEGSYRLDTWLNTASGEFADWVLKGSADGYAFFQQSQGDLTVLKQSFNWEWLKDRFKSIYGDIN
jgi:hypothetical protein